MKKMAMALVLVASPAFAASVDVWEGSGSLFDTKGSPTGEYRLVVENRKDAGQVKSDVTVTLPDGTVKKKQCLITDTGREGWKSDCDHGKGGGHCFGEGLCISYEEDSNGRAFATTIVFDGPSDMRLLRTELKNGQAVRFFREKLHKK